VDFTLELGRHARWLGDHPGRAAVARGSAPLAGIECAHACTQLCYRIAIGAAVLRCSGAAESDLNPSSSRDPQAHPTSPIESA
jgi:hypothetical protein